MQLKRPLLSLPSSKTLTSKIPHLFGEWFALFFVLQWNITDGVDDVQNDSIAWFYPIDTVISDVLEEKDNIE